MEDEKTFFFFFFCRCSFFFFFRVSLGFMNLFRERIEDREAETGKDSIKGNACICLYAQTV